MTSRLVPSAVTFAVYLCIGTLLTELLLLTWFWSNGTLSRDKWVRILAVVHEVELPDPQAEQRAAARLVNLSYEDLEQLRGVKALDLELKHQSLELQHRELLKQSERVAAAQRKHKALEEQLAAAFKQVRGEFDATSPQFQQLWTHLSAGQIKDHMLRMSVAGQLDAALLNLASMPLVKQARILKAFTAPEEQDLLHDILEKLRKRQPQAQLLETLEQELAPDEAPVK